MTVSIVTWHTSEDELRKILASLDHPSVKTVYIVDNSRLSRIRHAVNECHPRVEYLPHTNRGYGAGHNDALRRAMADGSRYHLVLNSDVLFDPSILPEMLAYMEANPDVGMLQPRLLYPDGRLQATCRLLPTPWDVFGRRFLPALAQRSDRRYTLADWPHDRPLNVPTLQGSFMLLRTKALEQVGLFDERYFVYCEDIDLTRRMHREWRTVYYPAVSAFHTHRQASYHSLKMLGTHIRNMIRYFNKWGWWRDPERARMNEATLKSAGLR